MNKEIKLYDVEKRDYPSNKDDYFRSKQVYECPVCHAKTNLVVMGGYPSFGRRTICPQSGRCWHHELEDKMHWLHKPHTENYKKELKKEIEEILRFHKDEIYDDIAGSPDLSITYPVTNTRSFCKNHL